MEKIREVIKDFLKEYGVKKDFYHIEINEGEIKF